MRWFFYMLISFFSGVGAAVSSAVLFGAGPDLAGSLGAVVMLVELGLLAFTPRGRRAHR